MAREDFEQILPIVDVELPDPQPDQISATSPTRPTGPGFQQFVSVSVFREAANIAQKFFPILKGSLGCFPAETAEFYNKHVHSDIGYAESVVEQLSVVFECWLQCSLLPDTRARPDTLIQPEP